MAKLAFVGLGLMGAPMATRLLEAGHDVTVWNRTTQKTKPLADQGASVASTPAQAAAGVEAAITMVANPEALEQVVLGLDGLAAALAPGPAAHRHVDGRSGRGPLGCRQAATRCQDGRRTGAGEHSRGDRRPAGHLRRRGPRPTFSGSSRCWRRSARCITSAGREPARPPRWS